MVSYLDEVENMRMIFSIKFVIPKFLCLIFFFSIFIVMFQF